MKCHAQIDQGSFFNRGLFVGVDPGLYISSCLGFANMSVKACVTAYLAYKGLHGNTGIYLDPRTVYTWYVRTRTCLRRRDEKSIPAKSKNDYMCTYCVGTWDK